MTRMNGGSSQGTQINFSFGDSTAWITSQQDVLTSSQFIIGIIY